ncbi:uncharacterized protein LOC118485003 [Helianthus annuus]|uniref:uncharacterized protein LOC118485003 n=1 Tax=Helianthus annuus TaxID=4232 RepID=UPI001653074E|nr:uncharacterized protein LOC118485003 [Helianthus annuus]
MEIGGHCALDWGALEEVAEAARARGLIGDDTPWSRLFDMAYTPSYRVMACEFLSSFDYAPRPADRPEEDDDEDDPLIEVSFRLAGQWHLMSLRQFAEHSGLYRVEELDTPIYTDGIWMPPRTTLMRFWQVISQHRFGTTSKQRASYITDPLYRYLHKLIATSITPREQSREWCTQGDLFHLYCLIWGEWCALHRCLASGSRRRSTGRTGGNGQVFEPVALPNELPELLPEPAQGEGQLADGDAVEGDVGDDDDGDHVEPPPSPPPVPFPLGALAQQAQPHGVPQYPQHVFNDELDPAVARALAELEDRMRARMEAVHGRMERLLMEAIQAFRRGEQSGSDQGAGTSGTVGAGPSGTTQDPPL